MLHPSPGCISQTRSPGFTSGLHMCVVGLAGSLENSLSQVSTLNNLENSHKYPNFLLPSLAKLQRISNHSTSIQPGYTGAEWELAYQIHICLPLATRSTGLFSLVTSLCSGLWEGCLQLCFERALSPPPGLYWAFHTGTGCREEVTR